MPWIKLSQDNPLRFRKEILPIEAGWQKNGSELPLTEDFIDSVIESTAAKLKNGVKTPLVLTHEGQEPYGQVVSLEKATNGRGGQSVFAVVDFVDEDMAAKGQANDVSVFIPPTLIDGKGNSYSRPLQHLALTPYPVVHGMAEWQPLAASFSIGTKSMDIASIAAALNVEIPADGDDAAIVASFTDAIAKLKAPPKKEEVKAPAFMTKQVIASRDLQLDNLVELCLIDAATRDKLSAKYCGEEHLSICLSQDSDDDFDFMVQTLKKNSPIQKTGQHDPNSVDETIRLALHEQDNRKSGEDSPVVAAAKRLAKR